MNEKIKASLLLLPQWLENAIAKSGENISIATDLTKLSRILTAEDVAFYISINKIFNTYGNQWSEFVSDMRGSFLLTDINSMTNDARIQAPQSNDLINGYTIEEYLENVNKRSDAHLLMNELGNAESLSTLLSMYVTINRSTPTGNNYVYELVELRENVYGLRIRQLNAEEEASLIENSITDINVYCYDTVLAYLSKFYALSELAQTSLFGSFVKIASPANQTK